MCGAPAQGPDARGGGGQDRCALQFTLGVRGRRQASGRESWALRSGRASLVLQTQRGLWAPRAGCRRAGSDGPEEGNSATGEPAPHTLLLWVLGPAPRPGPPSPAVIKHCTVDLESPKEGPWGP